MFVYTARSALEDLKRKNAENKNAENINSENNNDNSQNGVSNGNKKGKRFTSKIVKKAGSETPSVNGDKVDESVKVDEIRFPDYFPSHLKLFIEDDLAERRHEIEKQAAEEVFSFTSNYYFIQLKLNPFFLVLISINIIFLLNFTI